MTTAIDSRLSSMAGPKAPPRAGGDLPVRLFAASVRNYVPRLISSVSIACLAAFFVGPMWAAVWFAATWAVVLTGIGLMAAINARPRTRRAAALTHCLTLNSLASSCLSAGMPAALWATGDLLAQAFALVCLFIASSYVLLQYYTNATMFFLLLAPNALAMAYIAAGFIHQRGFHGPVIVTIAATAASLVNFFLYSRSLLDRSRSALRKARTRAEQGEAAAEAANKAKSAFLATMSHEIRTPLNGVFGMTQVMAAGPLEEVQRERLAIVRQSGEVLLAVLNDILDLSKIEAGKLEIEEIAFDFGPLAQGACAAFTAAANDKGLDFVFDVEAARGAYLGDPTRLRQILCNLISNALKFTDAGQIALTAAYASGALRIAVSDTGVGIPTKALATLFDKFTQSDTTMTRRFGGTGLGLAISHQLAALMGGTIEVVSEAGRGSTFTLIVPLERLADEIAPAGATPTVIAADAGQGPGLRVLAAEDNVVNQIVLRTLLDQIGIDATMVGDGAQALAAWEAGEWDAILMDIQMPMMDGPTAARSIRSREKESGRPRTPIIALTANAMSHQVDDYLAAGMDAHVAKPIEAERLYAALQSALAPAEAETSPARYARI
jgi:signal transduction histidine kinase/ActR/RegA family two-component response regulator